VLCSVLLEKGETAYAALSSIDATLLAFALASFSCSLSCSVCSQFSTLIRITDVALLHEITTSSADLKNNEITLKNCEITLSMMIPSIVVA
jgi:hypothetical protein